MALVAHIWLLARSGWVYIKQDLYKDERKVWNAKKEK